MDDYLRLVDALSHRRHADVDAWIIEFVSDSDEYKDVPSTTPQWTYLVYCALLLYTFPALTPATKLRQWVDQLPKIDDNSINKQWESPEMAEIAETAANQYHFTGSLSSFVEAKLTHDLAYLLDVNSMVPIIDLALDNEALNRQYHGLLVPFRYYHTHAEDPITLEKFLEKRHNHQTVFTTLVEPLNGEPVALDAWLRQVLLPVAQYFGDDWNPLCQWLFGEQTLYISGQEVVDYFAMLHRVIAVLVDSQIALDAVVEGYLAAVYYFSLCQRQGDKLSSHKLVTVYDTMALTLAKLVKMTKPSGNPITAPTVSVDEIDYLTLPEFIADPENPIRASFSPPLLEAVEYLADLVRHCQKMSLTCLLNIRKLMVYQQGQAQEQIDRDVARLTLNLTPTTWRHWWEATDQLITAFVPDLDHQARLYKQVIERCLFANLFDAVTSELFDHHRLLVNDQTWFDLVIDKFWHLFGTATSLSDKQGELAHASKCLDVLDYMSSKGLEVLPESNQQAVAAKHLMKLIRMMSNYKLPPNTTPKTLITRYTEDPLAVATLILTYNPKLYLGFDKLFKIVNDFAIYADYAQQSLTYQPKRAKGHARSVSGALQLSQQPEHGYFPKLKAACIELALADNNFQWAYTQLTNLFDYYLPQEINTNWLTFYQVGKYVDANAESPSLDVLQKQHQVLGRVIALMDATNDSQRVVLRQWQQVDDAIASFYPPQVLQQVTDALFATHKVDSLAEMTGEVNQMALSLLNDATTHSHQAGEKLLKMLVSGLGWAIGANK